MAEEEAFNYRYFSQKYKIKPEYVGISVLKMTSKESFNLTRIDDLNDKADDLKSLKELDIENNSLKSLVLRDFENLAIIKASTGLILECILNLRKLEVLDLSVNLLIKVPNFDNCPSLKELNLSKNILQKIYFTDFEKVKNTLFKLDLSYNRITFSSVAEFITFSDGIKNYAITEMSLKGNDFCKSNPIIKKNYFNYLSCTLKNLQKLDDVEIQSTNIHYTSEEITNQMYLEEKYKSTNKTSFEKDCSNIISQGYEYFDAEKLDLIPMKKYLLTNVYDLCNEGKSFKKLKILNLSNNLLIYIHIGINDNDFPNLQILNLSGNRLFYIFINNLPNLKEIDLSENFLKKIPDFSKFKKLININLSKNLISDFDSKKLEGLEALEVLSLSFNKIKFINENDKKIFEYVNNHLKKFNSKIFKFHLDENPIYVKNNDEETLFKKNINELLKNKAEPKFTGIYKEYSGKNQNYIDSQNEDYKQKSNINNKAIIDNNNKDDIFEEIDNAEKKIINLCINSLSEEKISKKENDQKIKEKNKILKELEKTILKKISLKDRFLLLNNILERLIFFNGKNNILYLKLLKGFNYFFEDYSDELRISKNTKDQIEEEVEDKDENEDKEKNEMNTNKMRINNINAIDEDDEDENDDDDEDDENNKKIGKRLFNTFLLNCNELINLNTDFTANVIKSLTQFAIKPQFKVEKLAFNFLQIYLQNNYEQAEQLSDNILDIILGEIQIKEDLPFTTLQPLIEFLKDVKTSNKLNNVKHIYTHMIKFVINQLSIREDKLEKIIKDSKNSDENNDKKDKKMKGNEKKTYDDIYKIYSFVNKYFIFYFDEKHKEKSINYLTTNNKKSNNEKKENIDNEEKQVEKNIVDNENDNDKNEKLLEDGQNIFNFIKEYATNKNKSNNKEDEKNKSNDIEENKDEENNNKIYNKDIREDMISNKKDKEIFLDNLDKIIKDINNNDSKINIEKKLKNISKDEDYDEDSIFIFIFINVIILIEFYNQSETYFKNIFIDANLTDNSDNANTNEKNDKNREKEKKIIDTYKSKINYYFIKIELLTTLLKGITNSNIDDKLKKQLSNLEFKNTKKNIRDILNNILSSRDEGLEPIGLIIKSIFDKVDQSDEKLKILAKYFLENSIKLFECFSELILLDKREMHEILGDKIFDNLFFLFNNHKVNIDILHGATIFMDNILNKDDISCLTTEDTNNNLTKILEESGYFKKLIPYLNNRDLIYQEMLLYFEGSTKKKKITKDMCEYKNLKNDKAKNFLLSIMNLIFHLSKFRESKEKLFEKISEEFNRADLYSILGNLLNIESSDEIREKSALCFYYSSNKYQTSELILQMINIINRYSKITEGENEVIFTIIYMSLTQKLAYLFKDLKVLSEQNIDPYKLAVTDGMKFLYQNSNRACERDLKECQEKNLLSASLLIFLTTASIYPKLFKDLFNISSQEVSYLTFKKIIKIDYQYYNSDFYLPIEIERTHFGGYISILLDLMEGYDYIEPYCYPMLRIMIKIADNLCNIIDYDYGVINDLFFDDSYIEKLTKLPIGRQFFKIKNEKEDWYQFKIDPLNNNKKGTPKWENADKINDIFIFDFSISENNNKTFFIHYLAKALEVFNNNSQKEINKNKSTYNKNNCNKNNNNESIKNIKFDFRKYVQNVKEYMKKVNIKDKYKVESYDLYEKLIKEKIKDKDKNIFNESNNSINKLPKKNYYELLKDQKDFMSYFNNFFGYLLGINSNEKETNIQSDLYSKFYPNIVNSRKIFETYNKYYQHGTVHTVLGDIKHLQSEIPFSKPVEKLALKKLYINNYESVFKVSSLLFYQLQFSQETLSQNFTISKDLQKYKLYGIDPKAKRLKSEENVNNPHLRSLIICAFLRCVYSILISPSLNIRHEFINNLFMYDKYRDLLLYANTQSLYNKYQIYYVLIEILKIDNLPIIIKACKPFKKNSFIQKSNESRAFKLSKIFLNMGSQESIENRNKLEIEIFYNIYITFLFCEFELQKNCLSKKGDFTFLYLYSNLMNNSLKIYNQMDFRYIDKYFIFKYLADIVSKTENINIVNSLYEQINRHIISAFNLIKEIKWKYLSIIFDIKLLDRGEDEKIKLIIENKIIDLFLYIIEAETEKSNCLDLLSYFYLFNKNTKKELLFKILNLDKLENYYNSLRKKLKEKRDKKFMSIFRHNTLRKLSRAYSSNIIENFTKNRLKNFSTSSINNNERNSSNQLRIEDTIYHSQIEAIKALNKNINKNEQSSNNNSENKLNEESDKKNDDNKLNDYENSIKNLLKNRIKINKFQKKLAVFIRYIINNIYKKEKKNDIKTIEKEDIETSDNKQKFVNKRKELERERERKEKEIKEQEMISHEKEEILNSLLIYKTYKVQLTSNDNLVQEKEMYLTLSDRNIIFVDEKLLGNIISFDQIDYDLLNEFYFKNKNHNINNINKIGLFDYGKKMYIHLKNKKDEINILNDKYFEKQKFLEKSSSAGNKLKEDFSKSFTDITKKVNDQLSDIKKKLIEPKKDTLNEESKEENLNVNNNIIKNTNNDFYITFQSVNELLEFLELVKNINPFIEVYNSQILKDIIYQTEIKDSKAASYINLNSNKAKNNDLEKIALLRYLIKDELKDPFIRAKNFKFSNVFQDNLYGNRKTEYDLRYNIVKCSAKIIDKKKNSNMTSNPYNTNTDAASLFSTFDNETDVIIYFSEFYFYFVRENINIKTKFIFENKTLQVDPKNPIYLTNENYTFHYGYINDIKQDFYNKKMIIDYKNEGNVANKKIELKFNTQLDMFMANICFVKLEEFAKTRYLKFKSTK